MGVINQNFILTSDLKKVFKKNAPKKSYTQKTLFLVTYVVRFFLEKYFLGFSIVRYIFPNNSFRSEFSTKLWIFYTQIDQFRKEKISLLKRTYQNFGHENMKSALQRLKRKEF
jgi:hypothetical protein